MARGEGIKKLSDLFAKYKVTLKAPQASVVEAFIEVVEDVTSIKLSTEQVEYRTHNRLVVLKCPGTIRSEIMLVKNEVLLHLKGRLGEKSAPSDIV